MTTQYCDQHVLPLLQILTNSTVQTMMTVQYWSSFIFEVLIICSSTVRTQRLNNIKIGEKMHLYITYVVRFLIVMEYGFFLNNLIRFSLTINFICNQFFLIIRNIINNKTLCTYIIIFQTSMINHKFQCISKLF